MKNDLYSKLKCFRFSKIEAAVTKLIYLAKPFYSFWGLA